MPETFAAELAAINERGTQERVIAEEFMFFYRKKLEDNPDFKDHELVKAQIATFEENLKSINAEWATAQLYVLNEISKEKGALANSLRPQARPTSLNTTLETTESTPNTTLKLSDIDETLEDANALFQKIEGKNPTAENITAFQEAHYIEADGFMGLETFGELRAWELRTQAVDNLKNGALEKDTQEEILDLLKYATLGTRHTTALFSALSGIEQQLKSIDSDFEDNYADFFTSISSVKKNFRESDEGKKVYENTREERESVYAIIKDPNTSFPEKIEALVTDPRLLFGAGILFLFGVIGGDTKYTDSFLKRIGVILGVAFLGKPALEFLGAEEAWDDMKSYWNSPEFTAGYEAGKNWSQETAESIWGNITGFDSSKIGDRFDSVWGDMKSVHADLVNDGKEYVSEANLPKFTKLTGLEAFWNLSKSDLSRITDYSSLAGLIPEEELNKLELSSSDNGDIKNFIQNYFLPQMGEDHEFVKDIFFVASTVETVSDFFSSFNGNYGVDSPAQNEIIKTDISNIIHSPNSSEAQKRAVRDLAQAAQSGDLSGFNIDNYPSVSDKTKIIAIFNKLTYIFSVQNTIASHIDTVSAIKTTTSGGTTDTQDTLTDKMKLLEDKKTQLLEFQEALGTGKHDINPEDFLWSNFESAYHSKRSEILQTAVERKIDTVGGENVTTALAEAEAEIEALERTQEVVRRIDELENFPRNYTTALDMRNSWDRHEGTFTELTSLKAQLDTTNEAELIASINVALGKKEEFIELYKEMRINVGEQIKAFSQDLEHIASQSVDSPSDFGARQSEIVEFIGAYNTFLGTIDSEHGWHIQTIWKDLFSGNFAAYTASSESNAIYDLDDKLELSGLESIGLADIREELRKTVRDIESRFSVDIGVESVNIDEPATIAEAVGKLKRLEVIVERGGLTFANADILAEKEVQISEQVQALNNTFVVAIEGAETPEELGDIYSRYRVFLEGEFSGTWDSIKRAVGYENDPVVEAYEKKNNELEAQQLEDMITEKLRNFNVTEERFRKTPAGFLADKMIENNFEFPTTGYKLKEVLDTALLNSAYDTEKIQATINLLIEAVTN